jgi:hypothetical protein
MKPTHVNCLGCEAKEKKTLFNWGREAETNTYALMWKIILGVMLSQGQE